MTATRSFILLAGDDGALLVPPFRHASDAPLFVPGHTEEKTLPIVEALAAQPKMPVLILADTLAQEFHRDTLPRLNVFDRKKLLARRLRQHFPLPSSTPHAQLTAAIPLKNNAALFACLHDGGPVATWMKRLETLSNPLTGVAPLPLVCSGIIARLMPEARQGWAMLLSWQRTGGFRQIVTHDGEFVFTRLTPPLPLSAGAETIIMTLINDLEATKGYLARLGLTEGTPLRLAAILPKTLHKAIHALPQPFQTAVTLTPHQAAKRLGLTYAPDRNDPAADLLYAAWVAKQKRLRPVMLPDDRRETDRTASVKRWGRCVAAAAWLAALAFFGWQGHDLFRLAVAHRQTTQDVAALQKQLTQERATLAPVTAPLGRLRQAVARQRLFTEPPLFPWPLLRALDKELGAAARITRLNWQSGKGAAAGETLEISLRLTESGLPPPSQEAGRQAIVKRFDQLAQSLRSSLAGYQVAVTRYPFLIKPDETLSNAGDKQTDDRLPTADFLLQKEKP
ncbi:MAG: hypothetical protein PHY92_03185 [Alphaproteobacteria bacterium]|nr:hypothetical protein [Alphaproteobacteria bacterium]